ncbi:hypothetical protein RJI07_04670 [Mycoplasmatota bacterium WC30]
MLTFENELCVDTLDPEIISKIKQYWESKTFVFTEQNSNRFVAKRGSAFKNNFTFNMMKLKSTLKITIEDNVIMTLLEVDPIGQIITEAEKRYWPLELDAFKQYILYGRLMEDEFNQYYNNASKVVKKIILNIILSVGLITILCLAFL